MTYQIKLENSTGRPCNEAYLRTEIHDAFPSENRKYWAVELECLEDLFALQERLKKTLYVNFKEHIITIPANY